MLRGVSCWQSQHEDILVESCRFIAGPLEGQFFPLSDVLLLRFFGPRTNSVALIALQLYVFSIFMREALSATANSICYGDWWPQSNPIRSTPLKSYWPTVAFFGSNNEMGVYWSGFKKYDFWTQKNPEPEA